MNDRKRCCFSLHRILDKCMENFVTTDDSIPWPEILFDIINVLYLVILTYYMLVAYMDVTWVQTLEAMKPRFMLTDFDSQIYQVSVLHHLVALLLLVTVAFGIIGSYRGSECALYVYLIMVPVIISLEFLTSIRVGVRTEDCVKSMKKLRGVLMYHVRNYYRTAPYMQFVDKDVIDDVFVSKPIYRRLYESTFLMNDIQRSLGCCGYDSYLDFLDPARDPPGRYDPVDYTKNPTFKVPASCCQLRIASNVHCAADIVLNTSDISARLFSEGCTLRILELCNEIVLTSGRGAFFLAFVHLALFLISFPLVAIQIKSLHFLAHSTTPYSYAEADYMNNMSHHVHPINENKHLALEHRYSETFHNDTDFVLNSELEAFVDGLRNVGAVSKVDEDVPKTVLLVKPAKGTRGSLVPPKIAPFVMRQTDIQRFMRYDGTFDFHSHPDVLSYAANVLSSPSQADKHGDDLKKVIIDFYKDMQGAPPKKRRKKSRE